MGGDAEFWVVSEVDMTRCFVKAVAGFCAILALTGAAQGYETEPVTQPAVVREAREQLALACVSPVTPQMAVTFGVPLKPTHERRACTSG